MAAHLPLRNRAAALGLEGRSFIPRIVNGGDLGVRS